MVVTWMRDLLKWNEYAVIYLLLMPLIRWYSFTIPIIYIYIWHYLICSIFINFNSFFQPFLNDATDSEDDEWRSSWADRLWIALGWKISSLLKKNIGSRDVNVIMENTISFDFMVRS
jgi:hypothetical protein